MNNNLFQAVALMHWLSRFSLGDLPCTTSLAVGGRYRMNNDNLSIQQSVPGSSAIVTADQDRTAATASFSLGVRKENLSAEMAYSGDYSTNNALHVIWLRLGYAF